MTISIKKIYIYFFLGISCFIIIGCSYAYKRDTIAYYEKIENVYQIEVTGKQRIGAHDPIQALFSFGVEEFKYIFLVPRIKGSVKGGEIPVRLGAYKYEGSIDFEGQIMNINLISSGDGKTKVKSILNGTYKLKLKRSLQHQK